MRHGPQGPGALVALRQAQGFMVVAHGARSLKTKAAPRVRRLSHEQGPPATRPVPLAGRFKLAVSAPPLRGKAPVNPPIVVFLVV